MIVSKKLMFVLVFARAKRRSGEISNFDSFQLRVASFRCQKSQKVLVSVVCFLIYFAVLDLVFERTKTKSGRTYPEKMKRTL